MAHGRFTGVVHCYSSSRALAERATALGLHLGIGGILTFKRSDELRDIVRRHAARPAAAGDRRALPCPGAEAGPDQRAGLHAVRGPGAGRSAGSRCRKRGEADDRQFLPPVRQGARPWAAWPREDHRPRLRHLVGRADDRLRLRRLPLDRPAQQAAPLLHPDRSAGPDHPGRQRPRPADAAARRRRAAHRCADLHPRPCRSRARHRRPARAQQRHAPGRSRPMATPWSSKTSARASTTPSWTTAAELGYWRPQLEPSIFDGPFQVGPVEILPFRQSHGRSDSWGLRIGDFAYSTDCDTLDEPLSRCSMASTPGSSTRCATGRTRATPISSAHWAGSTGSGRRRA